jgi:hypothetical protein
MQEYGTLDTTSRLGASQKVLQALLPSQRALEDAIRSLQESEFHSRDVAALVPWPDPGTEFSHRAGSKAPEGAVLGAITGAIVGSIAGWLVASGHPFLASVVAGDGADPLVWAFAGLGGLGLCGAILGALVGVRIPEYETILSEGVAVPGELLMSVSCRDTAEEKRATEILEEHGARAITTSCAKSSRARSRPRGQSSSA